MANPLRTNELDLKDPINDIQDGLIDPAKRPEQQEPPGFFNTLRNPAELILEESIPASLYQWITGNTKKVQAEKALKFLQQYPELQNSVPYKEAERIYNKYGYLLEEGNQSFDSSEFLKMAKQYPSVFGAELVNMMVADPYLLLFPALGFARLGRGVSNAIKLKYAKAFRAVPLTKEETLLKKTTNADILYGAMGSVLTPLAFSTAMQLGESGKISGSRTTAETTIGATAGLLISGALGTVSGLVSKLNNIKPDKINKIVNNILDEHKQDPEILFKYSKENGVLELINKIEEKTKATGKALDEAADPIKTLDHKEKITTVTRDLIDNAVNASKNSAIKNASTIGALVAAGSFITADDHKIESAGKGFVLGASIYGAARLANKYLKNPYDKDYAKIIKNYENTVEASNKSYYIYQAHMSDLLNDLNHLLPDPRSQQKIFYHTQGVKFEGKLIFSLNNFSKNEKAAIPLVNNIMKMFEKSLSNGDESLLTHTLTNYLPRIWDQYTGSNPSLFAKNYIAKLYGKDASFVFANKRLFKDINKAFDLGFRLRPGADNAFELIKLYSFAAGQAVNTRNILKVLRTTNLPGPNKIPYIAVTKEELSNLALGSHANIYVPFQHPYIKNGLEIKVHPALVTPLKMLFSSDTESKLMAAVFNINLLMKRGAVGFSFFHAGGLLESMLIAKLSFKQMWSSITGKSDLLKSVTGDPTLKFSDFPLRENTIKIIEQSGHKEVLHFAQSVGLEVHKPIDIEFDRFYAVLNSAANGVNSVIGNAFGTKTVGKAIAVFKWFDKITWDRIYTSGKLFTFLKNFESLSKVGDDLAKIQYNGQIASRLTNDAFGGLNWSKITQEIQNPIFKKLATTLFQPGSRGYMGLIMFAPDWTIANLRIAFKTLPMFEKDPAARRLYQSYFVRTALIYATIGSALNYIFSGHSLLENKDPTRIDLGNGDVLTFSKQFMEPFDWITDPSGTGLKKIGSLPKGVIEVLLNKQYLNSKWSPRIAEHDDNNLSKALKYGGQVGRKFLPIWVQQATETVQKGLIKDGISINLASDVALNWFLGQTGHPKYKEPRQSQYKLQGLVRNPYETLF